LWRSAPASTDVRFLLLDLCADMPHRLRTSEILPYLP
jgi:hypothetical protein